MIFRRLFPKSASKRRPSLKTPSNLRMEALEPRQLLAAADIVAENLLQGSPESEWGIDGTGTGNIQGFAADMSVDQGGTVQFKIDTDTADYRVDIYRLGWYDGLGARKVATVDPLSNQAQNQPNALYDSTLNMFDAGNWAVSAEWDVPTDAVSGVYIAKLVREDGEFGENHIVFVVRDDDGGSDIIMQTSDTTWQAYNNWGGASLYTPNYPNGRGRAVSYNRPIISRDINFADYLWGADYAMVRFLERNGYDVSYMTGIDASRYGSEILEHELYISVGHDEYWSGEQREAVSAARDAGIDLAFFSGNEVFWKVRWEESVDASATPYRTMVSYKETLDSYGTDPSSEWTGTWRDARFQDATGFPENELTGTIFTANHITAGISNVAVSIEVPAEYGPMRFWRNTDVANLTGNQVLEVGDHVLGYEFDEDLDNGFRPAGLIPLSYTTVDIDSKLYDEGYTFGPGTVNHSMTLYRAASGALVFGAGTVQYSWGLDTGHDGQDVPTDRNLQQATVNLFADMGVQPTTLMANLVAASMSTDFEDAVTAITSHSDGAVFSSGQQVTVRGTATDFGGGVVGVVEVSVDGGRSWRRATGRNNWSYTFTTRGTGEFTIMARATDDSGNIEDNPAHITVNPTPTPGVYSLWRNTETPTIVDSKESSSLELGVKFTTDVDGYITAIRFYKSAANTGTHTGHLWSATGQLLASVTFTGESNSGWQEAQFSQPVLVRAGETYVASYFAPNGHFSADRFYFTEFGVSNGPLHALRTGTDGSNGVYVYSGSSAFPSNSYQGSNYWVDVVFELPSEPDTTAPTVTSVTPADNATDVNIATAVQVTFSEAMYAASINGSNVRLLDGGNAVAANLSYNTATRTVTLTPTSTLQYTTDYTIVVSGVEDQMGNVLDGAFTADFTTADAPPPPPADTTPPTVTSVSPAANATSVATSVRPTIVFSEAMTASTINSGTIRLLSGGNVVSATVSYNATTRTATLTPAASLANSTAYTISVAGVEDQAGNAIASTYTANFTTAAFVIQTSSLWSNTTTPGVTSSGEGGSLELGVRLTANVDGYITGVRFYKGAGNNGTHTGSLWSSTGQLLARATFTSETNSGWQQVLFDSPVAITAGQTYVASYFAPNGNFPVDRFYFDSAYNNGPLRVATSGGVFAYGNAAQFPSNSYNSSNYWVDVVFQQVLTPDTTPPTVNLATPLPAAGGVSISIQPTVTFSEAMKASTISGNTVRLLEGNTVVATSVSYNAATRTATVTPASNLKYSTNYTLSVSGVQDEAGNTLADNFTRSFLTVDAPPADTTAPTVTGVSPTANTTGVTVSVRATVSFSEAMTASTVNATTVRLLNGNTVISASVSYNSSTRVATLTPSTSLASSTTYTIVVSGVRDLADNTLAGTFTSSFTTGAVVTQTSSLWNTPTPDITSINEPDSVELGTRFTANVDGYVTGIRFYKGAGNTGTHTGSLWSGNGQLLARATFTSESNSGWQEVTFDSPIAITAGQTYMASYFAPNGNFAVNRNYFNQTYTSGPLSVSNGGGVYAYGNSSLFPSRSWNNSNYWVDVKFQQDVTPDTTAPTVTGTSPAANTTGVTLSIRPTIGFSEAMNASTVNATNVRLMNGNTVIAAAVSYNGNTNAATITPSTSLASSTTYTIVVSGVRDLADNTLAGTFTSSFTTGAVVTQTSSLWNTPTPDVTSINEPDSVELGTRFTANVDGYVTGIRFYKGSGNTGTHTGSLWSGNGQLLARATFTSESNSGWQEVTFDSPIAITAGQTYVASYFAPNGNFAVNRNYFNQTYTSGPLSVSNGGGVYAYGNSSLFPSRSWNNSNYWVDVKFSYDVTP